MKAAGRLKKNAWMYTAVCGAVFCCLVAAAASGTGLAPAFWRMLMCLAPGGAGLFWWMSRAWPWAEQSEYFRAFSVLYHPGILLLSGDAFAAGTGWGSRAGAAFVSMALVAGWALLAAAVIVLILIRKEKRI
ncbi:MAG: hypothetical protein Q4C73_10180 [Eubacteriales bacterium]|nr:hypothetical protein [Eubacteriales bacterium]